MYNDIFSKKEKHNKSKPCYECSIRFKACHSKCPFYKAAIKIKDTAKAKADSEYISYVIGSMERMKRSNNINKRNDKRC